MFCLGATDSKEAGHDFRLRRIVEELLLFAELSDEKTVLKRQITGTWQVRENLSLENPKVIDSNRAKSFA